MVASDLMINTIADTLLHVGERIMCLTEEKIVLDVWSKPGYANTDNWTNFKGKDISHVTNDALIGHCADLIELALASKQDQQGEYVVIKHDHPLSYRVRALNILAGEQLLFVVFEQLGTSITNGIDNNAWKVALDAVGDGMWDMNMTTNRAFFSNKWHQKFGGHIVDITTIDDWTDIVHPDDYKNSVDTIQRYLAGNLGSYSCELRYRCKDGGYKWLLSRGVVVAKDKAGKPLRAIGTHTDIDERKRDEQTHFSTLQLLSNLIDNLQDGILVLEGQKVLFANQAYCDVYEIEAVPYDLEDLTKKNTLAHRKTRVKDPEKFTSRITEITQAREIVLNDEIELHNGKIYSRDFVPITLADKEHGEIWKFREITEQKQAQQRYEEQRLFYERILNSIPEDIAVHDPQHRFLFLNPSAIKDDELRKWLIGKHHEDYFNFRGLPLSLANVRNERFSRVIADKKPYQWIEKITNREGRLSHHMRCLYPLFDKNGEIDLVIVFGVNITERILAEQELKKSRDTFASAFNYSGIGMALLSEEGKWLEVNKAVCYITGYSKEELLQLSFQDITYPADLEADMHLVQKLLAGEISNYTLEKRYVSKSKKIVWAMLTVSFVKNNEDEPGFFVSQIVDITAKKELADEINRKNAELEAAKISLVNKISQMDELTHIIAHNLRGPAGNIKMLSARDNFDEDDISKTEALELIHQSSLALMDSLNTLMEMTLIKLNNNIAYDECNIPDIVNNIINQLHGSIYEKRAAINLELAIEKISYPKVYLESILYNLISNALKYSADDGQTVLIISTYQVNGKVALSVKDNGIGIDMNKYGNQVFKLNQVFHKGYDSKGVGLFITKTQIESLGGSIEVKSVLNEGSEFIVTF